MGKRDKIDYVIDDKGKVIIYDSKTDAYKVFQKMLEKKCPPSDWMSLLKEAEQQ